VSLSRAYLTPRQLQIWKLKNTGLKESNIARKLKVSRQTVHKALDTADNKILQTLEEVASLNKVKVKTVDALRGILVGYSPAFKTTAIITFSDRNGVQVWYKHKGDCTNCDQLKECKRTLITEMEDRNVKLPNDVTTTSPSDLAELLFSKILDEEK
jgi:transcriptional regulator